MVALKDFEHGDLILAEEPFVILPAHAESKSEGEANSIAAVEALSDEGKARFW